MNRRSDPGLGQWLFTTLLIGLGFLLIYKLIQYSAVRSYMPAGLTIAGVDVGGLDEQGVRDRLAERYLNAPVVIYHGENRLELDPREVADFELGIEMMLDQAQQERDQQDYWSGFWGFLWGRAVEIDSVPLQASHDRNKLIDALTRVANQYDQPAQPPQPVPTNLSFLYGEVGRQTNIIASLKDVEAALYRPTGREAFLVVEPVEPPRPNMNLLANLIVNRLEAFDGVPSIFILDLQTGREIAINADVAMSGMSIVKIPIVLETFRILSREPNIEQTRLISETLIDSGNFSANLLLDVVAGQDNAFLGADIVTDSLQKLGLTNTFIVTPYEEAPRPRKQTLDTPANLRGEPNTNPDPAMQTTAEDMGYLLSVLYYCAENGGGALIAVYEGDLTQEECQQTIAFMEQNYIGSLIEEGVPSGTPVAHKHGWISDTHGDAGIVYTPGGDYVIVMFLHHDRWLDWPVSSPIMADISRATYNYFNFDNPYLGQLTSN